LFNDSAQHWLAGNTPLSLRTAASRAVACNHAQICVNLLQEAQNHNKVYGKYS